MRPRSVGVSRDDLQVYLARTDISPVQRRLAELKLEYSEIGTIRTAQLAALEQGRIYPTVLPTQVTGRWSYLKPNLSGFSKKCINPDCSKGQHSRTSQCWSVQDCIRPDKGTFWIEHDLDAVEHRIYALILQWKERLDELTRGADIHTPVACTLFSLPYPTNIMDPHTALEDAEWREKVLWQGKDDQRRTISKNITYGGQYFYVRLAYPHERVKKPYRIYKGLWYNPTYVYTIPNIQTFKVTDLQTGTLATPDFEGIACRFVEDTVEIQKRKAAVMEKCRKDRESRTLYGGRRKSYFQTQETAKELFNAIIQGTVASYINESAILLQEEFPDSYLIHNKHDSLKWAFSYSGEYSRDEEEQQILERCKELCQRTLLVGKYEIPITATFKVIRRDAEEQHAQV